MNARTSFFCLFILFTFTFCQAQSSEQKTTSDSVAFKTRQFVPGKIHLKLVDTYELNFKVNEDKSIDVAEIPFLKKLVKKFGITNVAQELTLNNDSKLLRTLTVYFSETENVDLLIEKLSKNRNVEYAEKIPVPRIKKASVSIPTKKRR
ncbi:MAG: hypothetical protein MJZ76_01080 [Bacteroidales bacterium]|nr:hypothetical protein [Bacteroidales bacterium]